MTKIKICGITNKADAVAAAELGVDMLGFVFYRKSARYVDPHVACDIANELPPSVMKVGVFVDEDKKSVLETAEAASLDALQFHGGETAEYCGYFRTAPFSIIRAFRIKDKKGLNGVNDYDTDLFLLDTYSKDAAGGTGSVFDWKIVEDYDFLRPIIVSGGLDPRNVSAAIKTLAPYGVDVSSGVESSPGKKDIKLMKRFVENVRKVE
jgi:phosphoribosylanthranilate isomerase